MTTALFVNVEKFLNVPALEISALTAFVKVLPPSNVKVAPTKFLSVLLLLKS